MVDFQTISIWLTQTIVGVILLGALGSIVGSIVIFLVKKFSERIASSKDKLLLRFLYIYGRNVEIGTKVRDILGPKNKELQFIVYHLNQTFSGIVVALAFFFTATITAFVSIRYGIERPIFLSSFIASNIITFVYLIKIGTQLSSHNSDDLEEKVEEIESSQPKKFSDWYNQL